MERHKYKVEHSEFMFAQLTASLINFSMGRPEKPVQPKDFMPSQWGIKTPPREIPEMTEERRTTIANMFRAFGGLKVT